MNKLYPVILALAIGGAPLAVADDEHRAEHAKRGGEAESASGMMANDAMQERMQAMRETMHKIHDSQNPTERRQLMQEHMRQMHEAMGEMGRMGQHGQDTNGEMMKMDGERCQRMMQMHTSMMREMMDQMGAHMQAGTHHQRN